ncbi:MAG: biotin synthase BioB [Victivallales bacterium]|nr:biotin synthase BioB [Victivallales bacterium]
MRIAASIENAYKVLDGKTLTEDEAMALTELPGSDILDLVSLANKVRERFAPRIVPCSIINAKSGICTQNCRFCAQSGHHHTGIKTYPLLPKEEILKSARTVYEGGVRTFGIVTSGFGYTQLDDQEFQAILSTMDALRAELPGMKICVSLGVLSEETARTLAEHGVWRYNMNLQTNPERYAELISDTHTIDEKIQTIRLLQKHGVSVCCGGIFGLGETWRDRVKMAIACRELDVDGIPLNVLLPIQGTPLERQGTMDSGDVAKAFSIFRLLNPTKTI